MHFLDIAYDALLSAARPVIELGARGERARRAIAGRREAVTRFRSWARQARDPRLPLIWVHAPSVGEALMASAIIEAVREAVDVQVAFTLFSPSAERVAGRVGADVTAFLPWDTRSEIRNALGVLDPSVVAFIRTEIWPTLVRETKGRRARSVLLNAPLAATSSRMRPVARRLLRLSYSRLDAVGVVTRDDADRFVQLGVSRDRIQVTGDARFDQVVARVARIEDSPELARLADDSRPALVAGSTWREDEDLLVGSWPALNAAGIRLIIAPHEPTEAHLERLKETLDTHGLRHVRLSEALSGGPPAVDAIVIDRVGILAEVYSVGRMAWVGGGFGSDGLHSVIEPAALGLPVMFGPEFGNAREAARLVESGGGAVVTSSEDVAEVVTHWLDDSSPGRAAREFVNARTGGARRNARIILDFLPAPEQQPGGGTGRGTRHG